MLWEEKSCMSIMRSSLVQHEHADPPHVEQSLLEAPVQDDHSVSMTTCSSSLEPRDTARGKRRQRDG